MDMLTQQKKLEVEDNGTLEMIGRITDSLLPPGYGIINLVYRDIDCGAFGSKGWSVIIAYPKPKAEFCLGICWISRPDEKIVETEIRKLIAGIETAKETRQSQAFG